MIKLSERLLAVASYVEQDAVVADIGSDHAYLPSFLIQKGIVQKAIAGEVAQGPFDSASKNVRNEGLEQSVIVRLADGLFAIEEDDGVDTVTIAGMGGTLISSILESGKQRLHRVKRLIVQPNINAKIIREWAVANDWLLVEEEILQEDSKIYEILVMEKGRTTYDELGLLLGPILLTKRNEAFREKWESEIVEWKRVLQSIEKADETAAIIAKREELIRYITQVGKELEE